MTSSASETLLDPTRQITFRVTMSDGVHERDVTQVVNIMKFERHDAHFRRGIRALGTAMVEESRPFLPEAIYPEDV